MSTIDLQDAPWIKQAEVYGMPDAEDIPVICPMCGNSDTESFWFDINDDICGCDKCMKRKDAYEWTLKHREIHE